ncbi:hypothetical protein Dimus_015575 [Dionaea muscipula]
MHDDFGFYPLPLSPVASRGLADWSTISVGELFALSLTFAPKSIADFPLLFPVALSCRFVMLRGSLEFYSYGIYARRLIMVLLIEIAFKLNEELVTRADYLSGRTALHFTAIIEDVKCIRLLVADFLPGVPFDSIIVHDVNALDLKIRYDQTHVTFPHHYIGLLKSVLKVL